MSKPSLKVFGCLGEVGIYQEINKWLGTLLLRVLNTSSGLLMFRENRPEKQKQTTFTTSLNNLKGGTPKRSYKWSDMRPLQIGLG